MLYHKLDTGKYTGNIRGFPSKVGEWCKKLKYESKVDIRKYILSTQGKWQRNGENVRIPLSTRQLVSEPIETTDVANAFYDSPTDKGQDIKIIQYLGIAADEPKRIKKHIDKPNVVLPLVEIGWDEALCGLIAKYQDLLSPIYTTSMRGGCWFCHNQSIGQLRLLRKNYPDLWQLLLKWDKDSPVSFHPDGHTVHDFDERFALEDMGIISAEDNWKWAYLKDTPIQLKINI